MINFAYMQNLSKKKRLQPFYTLPAQKRHKKEKATAKTKKERYWTKTLQHDFYFETTTTVQHKREILNQVRMTL